MDSSSEVDIQHLKLAHRHRLSLIPPRQSFFRVVALVFYELLVQGQVNEEEKDGRTHMVIGANDEPCSIQGSICAERAALIQLRFLPLKRITKVVIVTDSPNAITPGMLCREFMTSHPMICIDTMPVLLGGSICCGCKLDLSGPDHTTKTSLLELERYCDCASNSKSNVGETKSHHDFRVTKTTLAELYPHPSPYSRLCSKEADKLGSSHHDMIHSEKLTKKYPLAGNQNNSFGLVKYGLENITAEDALSRLILLSKEASHHDGKRALHPIQYGAAVLFSDGTTESAYQKKALEYGCTLDAVGQLAHSIQAKGRSRLRGENINTEMKMSDDKSSPSLPLILVQTDQHGVLHAPFAPGRAFLHENDGPNRHCHVAVHLDLIESLEKKRIADVLLVPVSDLAPNAPAIWD